MILQSFEQINAPIKYAFFDLGGVVFNFSGGLESISKLINKPFDEVVRYWRSRDDQICLGQLPLDAQPPEDWY